MNIKYNDEHFTEEELIHTPIRIAKWQNEWDNQKKFDFTVFDSNGYDQMVLLKNIVFSSLCSHHLLPFHGKTHIAYIPNKKICGISKIVRTVDKFASSPQTQEQLTQDIADFIENKLQPLGVMVVMEAQHDCMRIRGVKQPESIMITSALRGTFKQNLNPREEFLKLIR